MDNFFGDKLRQIIYDLILSVARHIFFNIVFDTLQIIVVAKSYIIDLSQFGRVLSDEILKFTPINFLYVDLFQCLENFILNAICLQQFLLKFVDFFLILYEFFI